MVKRLKNNENLNQIQIRVNGKEVTAYEGESITTAIMNSVGIGYSETKTGEMRGPVCNMGVCYECSVYVSGLGRIKGCMTKVEEGMDVQTNFKTTLSEITPKEAPQSDDEKVNEVVIYDVAVVGAGPAGLGAIEELSGHGLKVAIIDEQQQSGGQIFRQPPEEYEEKGGGYDFIKRVEKKQDIQWIRGGSVWSIQPKDRGRKATVLPEDADLFEICVEGRTPFFAKQIILATGAYDRLLPVPGWQNPGVMSAGGIQVFLKAQSLLPGEKTVFAGSHPFLFIVAAKVIECGGEVSGIIFSQKFPNLKEIIQHGMTSLKHTKKISELLSAYQTLRKAKVPILYGNLPVSIQETNGLKKVSAAPIVNEEFDLTKQTTFEGNVVGMCYGFNASSELARQIGCEMTYNFQRGGMIATHNKFMQSSVKNVFVAGEITGVGGAELSEAEGRLAALGILKLCFDKNSSTNINSLLKQKEKWQTFANMLHKLTAFPEKNYVLPLLQEENTYLCRCEQVKVKEVINELTENPSIETLNAVKLKTRSGMGLCQGRNCEHTLKALLQAIYPNRTHIHGSFTTRYPVKPVNIGELIKGIE